MKNILFSTIFWFSQINIYACSCRFSSFAKDYLSSDIVALAEIKNVYGNNYNDRTYKIDLEFQKIYKGKPEIKTFIVNGLIGEFQLTACERPFEKGMKHLVFFQQNESTISSCSPIFDLDGINFNKNKSNIESIFKFLETNKFENNEFISYYETPKNDKILFHKNSLSKIKKFNPKNSFAVYKILVDNEQNVVSAEVIIPFGDKDKKITDIIQHKLIITDDDKKINNKVYYMFLNYKPENDKNRDYDNEIISSDL